MSKRTAKQAADSDERGYPSAARGWYAVVVLMTLYVFSYIDRTILTLLVGPIRADLHINDTQVSLLHGFAFVVFYTVLGLPLGRLADSRHRIGIISIGIFLWSLMTAASGFARSFWQLFLCRMGVGVGEAALSPASYSIIADYFPPAKLSRALSTYVMASYLGMALAYLIGGGVVSALHGMPDVRVPMAGFLPAWRIAFLIVGLPGLLLALIVWTVREPSRRGALQRAGKQIQSVPLSELATHLRLNKWTYSAHFFGFGLLCLLINGMALWTPTFLIRVHGWTVGEAGTAYGLMIGIFGGLGVVSGGWFSDYLQNRGVRGACFIAAAIGSSCAIVPTALMPLMPTGRMVLVLMAPALYFGSFPFGLAVSAIQQITPNQLRGQASALYLFFCNLLGIGCGPLAVAVVTDYVFHNDAAVGYSMAMVGGLSSVAATIVLWFGVRPYSQSIERTETWASKND